MSVTSTKQSIIDKSKISLKSSRPFVYQLESVPTTQVNEENGMPLGENFILFTPSKSIDSMAQVSTQGTSGQQKDNYDSNQLTSTIEKTHDDTAKKDTLLPEVLYESEAKFNTDSLVENNVDVELQDVSFNDDQLDRPVAVPLQNIIEIANLESNV